MFKDVWENLFEMMENDRGLTRIVVTIAAVLFFLIGYGIFYAAQSLAGLIFESETIVRFFGVGSIVIYLITLVFFYIGVKKWMLYR